jgi:hypothetical protein
LTSPRVKKASRMIMLMKASKLVEMTHKWRLLREGHPLLRRVKIIPR